jgi:hypothetical protein
MAYIYITGMQYSQKVDLLERYYIYAFGCSSSKKEEILSKINYHIGKLREFGKQRNSIAHANYYTLDKDGFIREKIKFIKTGIEEVRISINKDTIIELINAINEENEIFYEFDEEFIPSVFE